MKAYCKDKLLFGNVSSADQISYGNGTVKDALDLFSGQSPSVGQYATEEWVNSQGFAKTSDIPSLSGYATETWVGQQGYAKTSDIPSLSGYATETWVGQQGFAKANDIPSLNSYATETWVNSQGYAKTGDIPSLSGYATETWVNSQGYAKANDIPTDDHINGLIQAAIGSMNVSYYYTGSDDPSSSFGDDGDLYLKV